MRWPPRFHPKLIPPAWSTLAAKAVHFALYALMITLPVLGLVYVFGNDKGVDFGIFKIALPLKDVLGGYAKSARWWHETLGIGILLLALLHAIAALGHHYLLKDGTARTGCGLPDSPRPVSNRRHGQGRHRPH